MPVSVGREETIQVLHRCGSRWCHSLGKRAFDVAGALMVLLPALPVMAVVALAVKWTSPGPVLFRQMRCGKDGRPITIVKFRTMMQNADTPGATRKGDRRVTRIGGYLRDWKLDELPQLFNVLRGELSLVGPRPNLPRYWRQLPHDLQCALAVKPGVTSLATLEFRDEEDVLNTVAPENLDQFYLAEIFPAKVATDLRYAEQATLLSDLKILLRTVSAVFKLNGTVRATARART